MQFTIRNGLANKDFMVSQIKASAWKVLAFYRVRTSEYALDKYLRETYNLGLREAGLHILRNSTFHKTYDKSIVVLFKDKNIDKLATLITYGNGQVHGSDILKQMFFRKD